MSISELRPGEAVRDVRLSEDTLSVDLVDGRMITVPLVWYPRLLDATPKKRKNWQIIGAGYGIHWPDVDEDLSSEGLLRGAPAPRALSDEDAPVTVEDRALLDVRLADLEANSGNQSPWPEVKARLEQRRR